MEKNKQIQEILRISEDIFRAIQINIPAEWLSSDMTVAQLRILLLLHTEGPRRMGNIAGSIGTTLPTASGTVDNLVKKGLVSRGDDPEDRRLVICSLTEEGRRIISLIWASGQNQIEGLLHTLTEEDLKVARKTAEILLASVTANYPCLIESWQKGADNV